jgi:hypothetical protein
VDGSGNVGEWSSLALAPSPPYTPHISYYDVDNEALKHAWWTHSGWLSETVDDTGEQTGLFTSLAIEPAEPYTAHISYLSHPEASTGTLRHAWQAAGGWLSETVDSSSNQVGWNTSLALAATQPYTPHIAYDDLTNGMVKHAWRTASGWQIQVASRRGETGMDSSLAIEPTAASAPHISYHATPALVLKHAWRVEGHGVYLPVTLRGF